eukprot:10478607-Lingulodinium_polyedra.AAC.1
MDPALKQRLLTLASQRRLGLVWIGLVCSTWSRARDRPGGPPPLRSSVGATLWGLRHLAGRDREKVLAGNAMAKWGASLFVDLAHLGVPVVIEDPRSS